MAELESEFVCHMPCDTCGSSDANSLYTDGHMYCFSCNTYVHGDEPPQMSQSHVMIQGEPQRLSKRKISEEVCRKYKIYRDKNVLRFYYTDKDNRIVGCKIKTKDKDFRYEGSRSGTLWGQSLFPSSGRRVVITEGELDAASCAVAMPSWPHVSLPSGAASAKKSIQQSLEWLQGFDEIVLFFDNDEAGRKAAEESANVLPPGKVSIALLDDKYKDASDALMADDAEAVRKAIWDAKIYRPDGIVDAKTLRDKLIVPKPVADFLYPFQGLNDKLMGMRYGELTTWTGGTSTGKSTISRTVATHLLMAGEKVGYVALEESNHKTALSLMSISEGVAFNKKEYEKEVLEAAYDNSIANWDLFLYDGFGSFDPDIIYNRIDYLANGLDCKIIFLDHLSILLSGLDGDERRMIDQTMTKLRSLVERTGIALNLVCHLKGTDEDGGHEEGARVKINQLRGSRAIGQISDIVIGIERDLQDESEESTTTIRVLKNREHGSTGIACNLKYDPYTCKYTEVNETESNFNPTTDF